PLPPCSPLFPYTTLFRSHRHRRLRDLPDHRLGLRPSAADRGLARAAAPRAGAARPSLIGVITKGPAPAATPWLPPANITAIVTWMLAVSSGGDIRGRQACGRAAANRSKPQPGSSPSPCSGSPWRVGSPARAQAVVPPSP